MLKSIRPQGYQSTLTNFAKDSLVEMLQRSSRYDWQAENTELFKDFRAGESPLPGGVSRQVGTGWVSYNCQSGINNYQFWVRMVLFKFVIGIIQLAYTPPASRTPLQRGLTWLLPVTFNPVFDGRYYGFQVLFYIEIIKS